VFHHPALPLLTGSGYFVVNFNAKTNRRLWLNLANCSKGVFYAVTIISDKAVIVRWPVKEVD